ncbi:hypothetical protein EPD60_13195 [Flaviaesturariibacter flavus]|uniref:Uncharacterized protein n=1 Tax=Flaviaesturariibacter flavus TaxID=2502780 RepID=A0A4R1B5R7_9BACT|nr:hypothetical protein [Flaviaesturariibacter flavus]TCJ13341.1 hypothetical protein EPD60_13195 [Flaviaesturariibacter flavus]
MKLRYLIPFLTCILLLIASEYFLLSEVWSGRRLPVILGSSAILLGSIVYFWRSYRRFRQAEPVQA